MEAEIVMRLTSVVVLAIVCCDVRHTKTSPAHPQCNAQVKFFFAPLQFDALLLAVFAAD